MAVVDTPDRSLPIGRVSARQVIVLVVASAVMVAGLVVIAPALADLPDVWTKLADGDLGWLAFALVLEALSFVGHAILFRAVSVEGGGTRIGLRASTEITLAGHAATRLFASAGAGRHRPHRLGAEAVRHGGARRRRPHDDLHGAALQRLHGLAADRRRRPLHRAASPAAARSR